MKRGNVEIILREYDGKSALYSELTTKVEKLIAELLKENGIRVHTVTGRLKTRDSLKSKLERLVEPCEKINDIIDICGVRITTYFADDVNKVAEIIEKEFKVDPNKSANRGELLDPDRFGYLSLHYISSLTPKRLKLTEYKRFADCKIEIQIRSILQHAWAEIEHDLGYKTKQSVPKEIRRRFAMLAGLLELADGEFIHVRDNLAEYKALVPNQIAVKPSSVYIDKASVWAFVQNSKVVSEIESEIVSNIDGKIIVKEEFIDYHIIACLHYIGYKTIADINSSMSKFKNKIIYLASNILGHRDKINRGLSLLYLCYAQISNDKSAKGVCNFLKDLDFGPPYKPFSEKVYSLYKKAPP